MKIYVHRTPAIMDGLVIRWNASPWPYASPAPEISASRTCVQVNGFWEFADEGSRQLFEAALSEAWKAFKIMKPGRYSLTHRSAPARYANEIDVPFGESLEDAIAKAEQRQPGDGYCECGRRLDEEHSHG